MIDPGQLREYVVGPALEALGLWSDAAENLVMGTAAQESRLRYIHQLGDGPALGLWQMEPATHRDIWDHYLAYQPDLELAVRGLAGYRPRSEVLIYNLRYAAAMCRIHYYRAPEPIPQTVEGMAALWKLRYNTPLGAGTEQEFIDNYRLVE